MTTQSPSVNAGGAMAWLEAAVPVDSCNAIAGHVPGVSAVDLTWHTMTFQAHGAEAHVAVPRLTPEQLGLVASTVATAARTRLASMPVADIVDAIDLAIARMLDADDPARRQIDHLLPIVSGFDAEMTRLGLNAALKAFRRPQLLRFLAEDFTDPALLDGFRPRVKGGWTRACGPGLLAHVWAGNVPGLPLWSLISGLLVKAGNLGKVSSDEPLVAAWFARTLAQVEPRLADALAIVWWPGGDAALEEVVCRHADVFKVYGGDTAVAAWQRKLPVGKRLLAHGHKFSAGLVSAAALDTRQAHLAARQAALDVVRWDQQGCYSPQLFYVERGAQVSPRDFACHLAGELGALQHTFPRRDLSLEEGGAVAAWRQTVELDELRGETAELLGPPNGPWSVAYVDSLQLGRPSALSRSVCVVAVERLEDAVAQLGAQRDHLQTVGIAAEPEELFRLAPLIAEAGATRICALGAMTQPEPGWHHDGRFSLLDLVRMVDIEASAEDAAESFARYRD